MQEAKPRERSRSRLRQDAGRPQFVHITPMWDYLLFMFHGKPLVALCGEKLPEPKYHAKNAPGERCTLCVAIAQERGMHF